MEENKNDMMGVVVKVPQRESGVPDAVEMQTEVVVAEFASAEGKVIGIDRQTHEECKLLTSYERGTVSISVRRKEKPFMVSVRIADMMALIQAVEKCFDMTPQEIIERMDLRRPIYEETSAYGHFGCVTGTVPPWEETDMVDMLRHYYYTL